MENPIMATLVAYMFMAMICSGLATALICLFLNVFVMPFFKSKALSKAWKEGRVIEAKVTKVVHARGTEEIKIRGRTVYAWVYYEYYYAGKKYKLKLIHDSGSHLYNDITLYFKKNPAKAVTETDFGRIEHEWKPVFGILTVIFLIVIISFT